MKVWLDAPDALAELLGDKGGHLSRAAIEALAAEAYRAHRLAGVELCRILNISSRNDLDAFLKRHGVTLEYTVEDFEREGRASARIREKRQAEIANDRHAERSIE